ncbi:hypothetical protein ACFY8K_36980 [Streptomyces misionensis]|uniref:hypothetical protein n=1 Tax=Streptomyces misionensis TaxID=67331 RepID=UPI003686E84F
MPIPVKDVTSDYESLLKRQQSVADTLMSTLRQLGKEHPSLIAATVKLLDSDGSVHSPFRMLPFPVLGALTADQDPALPVVMCSRIWWTGAEVLDDLADGDFHPAEVGLSPSQATVASAACLGDIPQTLIQRLDLPQDVRAAWAREFASGSLRAAEGQLRDVSVGPHGSAWPETMRIYVGKSGAPYGRDMAMTAMLAGAGAVAEWRAFGHLFGVLRQMANDRDATSADEDKDLANGTRTLLVALAADALEETETAVFRDLRVRATRDAHARRELWQFLTQPDITTAYNRQIRLIHRKLSELLKALTDACGHQNLIQWMINVSAQRALLTVGTGVA